MKTCICAQPSEPSEGESEFDAEEDDELLDEEAEEVVGKVCPHIFDKAILCSLSRTGKAQETNRC
jgi:hypothetical protein